MSLHVGEIGVVLELDMVEDVSAAQTYTIFLRRPDGSVITGSAALVQGSTTKIEYTFVAGDLTIAGAWKAQPRAEWASGDAIYGEIRSIKVEPVLG